MHRAGASPVRDMDGRRGRVQEDAELRGQVAGVID